MATKLCPNCGWRKEVSAEVCHCGYDFVTGNIETEKDASIESETEEANSNKSQGVSKSSKSIENEVDVDKMHLNALKIVLFLVALMFICGAIGSMFSV